MEKKIDNISEPIAPDLKHDNMEFVEPADSANTLDVVDEEAEITSEELDALYADDVDEEAEALNAATNDSLNDADNFIIEPDDIDDSEED